VAAGRGTAAQEGRCSTLQAEKHEKACQCVSLLVSYIKKCVLMSSVSQMHALDGRLTQACSYAGTVNCQWNSTNMYAAPHCRQMRGTTKQKTQHILADKRDEGHAAPGMLCNTQIVIKTPFASASGTLPRAMQYVCCACCPAMCKRLRKHACEHAPTTSQLTVPLIRLHALHSCSLHDYVKALYLVPSQ
jgi:hypothetical protein